MAELKEKLEQSKARLATTTKALPSSSSGSSASGARRVQDLERIAPTKSTALVSEQERRLNELKEKQAALKARLNTAASAQSSSALPSSVAKSSYTREAKPLPSPPAQRAIRDVGSSSRPYSPAHTSYSGTSDSLPPATERLAIEPAESENDNSRGALALARVERGLTKTKKVGSSMLGLLKKKK